MINFKDIIKFKKATKTQEYFIVLISFLFLVFGFLAFTGTLFSGFHFTVDHEMVRINDQLKHKDFCHVAKGVISNDLNKRFRPFYYLHRVLQTRLFGINFTLWYIYNGLLAAFCAFFLYLFARNANFSFAQSLFFSFLTLLGPQAAIWWRLGLSETQGMFFLALCLFFLAKSVYAYRHNVLYNLAFVVSLIITSLCKESFIVLIPAILFWKIWLYSSRNKISFMEAIYKNLFSISLLVLIMLIELYIIIAFVGTNKLGYVGVDQNIHLFRLLGRSIYFTIRRGPFILALFGVFLIMRSRLNNDQKFSIYEIFKVFVDNFLKIIILFSLIFFPQAFLYNKTGFWDRYFLPAFLAFSVLIIYLQREINKSGKISYFSQKIFVILLIIMLWFKVEPTIRIAKAFTNEGVATNSFLKSIAENTNEDSEIVIASDPVDNFEWSISISTYLKLVGNRNNHYFIWIETDCIVHNSEFSERLRKEIKAKFKDKDLTDIDDFQKIECVGIFPGLEKTFLAQSSTWFKRNRYQREASDKFVVYIKKDGT
ncbi:MAG TPA: hypothetical protein VMW39_03915 [bacterium]|nr:hypothetical protein [bacterium]